MSSMNSKHPSSPSQANSSSPMLVINHHFPVLVPKFLHRMPTWHRKEERYNDTITKLRVRCTTSLGKVHRELLTFGEAVNRSPSKPQYARSPPYETWKIDQKFTSLIQYQGKPLPTRRANSKQSAYGSASRALRKYDAVSRSGMHPPVSIYAEVK